MRDVLRLLIAPLFWLAAFSAVYGLHGVVCSPHSDILGRLGLESDRVVLIGAWIAALAAQIATFVALLCFPSPSGLVQRVAILVGATSIVAMIWTLFPVLLSPVCA